MSDAHPAMEQLRTALKEEGVVTVPHRLSDAGIARIVALAHQANAALEADRVSIPEIADKVRSAVKVGGALGKTDREIRADVHAIVGHLSIAQIDAVHAHITASIADDNAYTAGTYTG